MNFCGFFKVSRSKFRAYTSACHTNQSGELLEGAEAEAVMEGQGIKSVAGECERQDSLPSRVPMAVVYSHSLISVKEL